MTSAVLSTNASSRQYRTLMGEVEKLLGAQVDQKGQGHANKTVGLSTPKQESSKLTNCAVPRLASLHAVPLHSQRKQQKRDLSLESDWDDVLDESKTKVKGWIESLLEDILTGTLGITSSAFNDLTSSIYGNSFDFDP
jgi:hypothetical protein